MNELYFFLLLSSIIGGVFFVSLFELILTIRRRKVHEELEEQIHTLKTHYNQQINELVLKDDSDIVSSEEQAQEVLSTSEQEQSEIEEAYKARLKSLEKKSEKALEAAEEKARLLEEQAEMQAEEYLRTRQDEVERELMNLVMAVTKKVLPKTLTYDIQKKLVLDAMRDVKTEKENVL